MNARNDSSHDGKKHGLKRCHGLKLGDGRRTMGFGRSILFVMMGSALAVSVTACNSGDGGGQKTKGQLESAAGSLTGDAKLKRQGQKDEVVGGVKKTVGDVKDAVHDATH